MRQDRPSYLDLSSDFMFCEVMRSETICRRFLEELLETKLSRLRYLNKQQDTAEDPKTHDLFLDIYAEDTSHNRYNIEMEKWRQYNEQYRVRYTQSVLDQRILGKGKDYRAMPRTYVIFLCDFDPFCTGRAKYLFRLRDEEDPSLVLEEGRYAYFLNTRYRRSNASEEILRFLDAVREGGYTPGKGELADWAVTRAEMLRNDGRMIKMFKTMEMRLQEERILGRIEGICETVYDGLLPLETAAQYAGFTPDEFLECMHDFHPDWTAT